MDEETKLKAVRVKSQDGYTTFTRKTDGIDKLTVTENNVLILRKKNGDAVAMFNPLGWQHVEVEWMPDANS